MALHTYVYIYIYKLTALDSDVRWASRIAGFREAAQFHLNDVHRRTLVTLVSTAGIVCSVTPTLANFYDKHRPTSGSFLSS